MSARLPEELLEGLSGEQRSDRAQLLRWLLDRDVEVEEIRRAIDEDRLALLPTELLLTRGCRYSLQQAARKARLDPDFIQRVWRAAGIAIPEGDEPLLDDEDIEAIGHARQALDAGFPEEAYIEVSRVVGRGASHSAEAMVQAAVEGFRGLADGEQALAMRLAEMAEQLIPLLPAFLAFPVRMHLRDATRQQVVEHGTHGVEGLRGTRELAIGFADMEGFTSLSEQLSLAQSASLATRLERLASSVAEPPVRLVKLIGDCAMLVSADPRELVRALRALAEAAARESDFPQLRMGAASGEVAIRAGDVYGPAVNLASRLADMAKPRRLLVAPGFAKQLEGQFETKQGSPLELKGIGEIQPLEIAF